MVFGLIIAVCCCAAWWYFMAAAWWGGSAAVASPRPNQRLFAGVLFALAATYALAVGVVFSRPRYADNGGESGMVFPEHLMWAIPFAALLQIAVVPAVLWLLSSLFRRVVRHGGGSGEAS